MPERSRAYERFWWSIDEATGREWLDHGDTAALLALHGAERDETEERLIALLERAHDHRIPKALIELRSTRAIPRLLELARRERSIVGILAAEAVRALGGGEVALDAVVATARGGDETERTMAASVLARFRGPEAGRALRDLLDDPEHGVRSNAFSALVRARGLEPYYRAYDVERERPLELLGLRLASRLPGLRGEAAAEARRLFDALDGGASPEALGLERTAADRSPAAARLVRSLRDSDEAAARAPDLGALRGLSEEDRRWVEDCLLGMLDRDDRAAGALAALRELAGGHPATSPAGGGS